MLPFPIAIMKEVVKWPRYLEFRNLNVLLRQYEPRYEKTGFLHMQKQRRRSASR